MPFLVSVYAHLVELRVEFGKAREEGVAGGDAFESGGDEGGCVHCREGLELWEAGGGAGE